MKEIIILALYFLEWKFVDQMAMEYLFMCHKTSHI